MVQVYRDAETVAASEAAASFALVREPEERLLHSAARFSSR